MVFDGCFYYLVCLGDGRLVVMSGVVHDVADGFTEFVDMVEY